MSESETSSGLEGFGTSAARLFEAIMEQSQDRIYIKDSGSRFIACSCIMAEDFGVDSPEDLYGKTDFDFFTEEHARQAFEDEQRIMQTGVPIIGKVEKETRAGGKITWASSTKAPLFLNSGKIVGIIGISRDVTSEHEAQAALEQSESKLRERDLRLRRDLSSARHVQQVFIPGDLPKVSGFKIALRLMPMDEVGGDIITFPQTKEDNLLVFIGDVSGHGVTAALFTLLLKYLTDRQGENYTDSPQKFLRTINLRLAGRIPDGFVAGICAELGKGVDGSAYMTISNAGYPEFIHQHAADGSAELVKLPLGNVLGLPLNAGSSDLHLPLASGDRLLFYTDGIVEARNDDGEEFGNQRLAEVLAAHTEATTDDALDAIMDSARAHSGGGKPKDDISLLLIEVE